MASNNTCIYVIKDSGEEGYLSTDIKSVYSDNGSKLDYHFDICEEITDAFFFKKKSAKSKVSRLRSYGHVAVAISPFSTKDLYCVSFDRDAPEHGSAMSFSKLPVNLFALKDKELNPTDFKTKQRLYFFDNKFKMYEFIHNKIEFEKSLIKKSEERKVKKYDSFLQKDLLTEDEEYQIFLRDKTIEQILE